MTEECERGVPESWQLLASLRKWSFWIEEVVHFSSHSAVLRLTVKREDAMFGRWIKIFVILTLLLLLLPQVSGENQCMWSKFYVSPSVLQQGCFNSSSLPTIWSAADQLVEDGSNITLPCENLIDNQNECINVTWKLFLSRDRSIELIKLGQIGEQAGNKSHRLQVLKNCSLGIKNVAAEDAGVYSCQQFLSDQKPATPPKLPIKLSVVTSE